MDESICVRGIIGFLIYLYIVYKDKKPPWEIQIEVVTSIETTYIVRKYIISLYHNKEIIIFMIYP